MEPKRKGKHWVGRTFNQPQTIEDVHKIETEVLWGMADRNLTRMALAWEGGMSESEREYRARLVQVIVRELRERSYQLRM